MRETLTYNSVTHTQLRRAFVGHIIHPQVNNHSKMVDVWNLPLINHRAQYKNLSPDSLLLRADKRCYCCSCTDMFSSLSNLFVHLATVYLSFNS